MMKAFNLVAVAAVLAASNSAFGAAAWSGSYNGFPFKLQIQDPKHEELAVPLTAEGDFCVDILNVDGFQFGGPAGDAGNQVYTVDLGSLVGGGPVTVTDIGWNVDIAPIGASWYSEAAFLLTSDDGNGVSLAPGSADGFAGNDVPMNYDSMGLLNLGTAGIPDLVDSGGLLGIELLETFDDFPGAPDANLLFGSNLSIGFLDAAGGNHTATLKFVPEPASFGLFGLAGVLLLGIRRRL